MRAYHGLLTLLLLLPGTLRAQQLSSTRLPALQNPHQVGDTVARLYPPDLRARHVAGTVHVLLHVSEAGAVDSARVAESSGTAALDSAGLRAARAMRFTPGLDEGRPVPVWVEIPIAFRVELAPALAPASKLKRHPARIELLNRAEVEDAIRSSYGDTVGKIVTWVSLRINVDSAGLPREASIDSGSCFPAIDAAAIGVPALMRFAPALPGDSAPLRPTRVTLAFGLDSGNVSVMGDDSIRALKMKSDHVPSMTRAPRLLNRGEMADWLVRAYPAKLREATIGGTALVWVLVGKQGRVIKRGIQRTSGYCGLDIAALRVVDRMRFSPALLDRKPVKAWVRMPIIFKVAPALKAVR